MNMPVATSAIYPELQGFLVRDQEAPPPPLPDECPVCGSPASYLVTAGETTSCAIYGCDGHYTPKPQIQNHTRVWWGACGKVRENAFRAMAAFWIKSLEEPGHQVACAILDRLDVAAEQAVSEVAFQLLAEEIAESA